jgi:hypothetical protein
MLRLTARLGSLDDDRVRIVHLEREFDGMSLNRTGPDRTPGPAFIRLLCQPPICPSRSSNFFLALPVCSTAAAAVLLTGSPTTISPTMPMK